MMASSRPKHSPSSATSRRCACLASARTSSSRSAIAPPFCWSTGPRRALRYRPFTRARSASSRSYSPAMYSRSACSSSSCVVNRNFPIFLVVHGI
ncbi:Uncharacterised protein [Mycobacteroides abscessus subsp. abscessus]|nr:Uncharacterised protein [Mycobacteroides abscessus subsp. abscessus]